MAEAFTVKLRNRAVVARETCALHFEKPPDFQFKPGQFLEMTLVEMPETDEQGNTRSFSIASAPSAETLMVVTRMRDSAFKRTLNTLPLESEVRIEGPYGSFILPEDAPHLWVFIAGGIGITPFLSMLRSNQTERGQACLLFYANREPRDAPFLQDLTQLQSERLGFRLVATMTGQRGLDLTWKGETGRIDKGMLLRYLKPSTTAAYFIAGPPEMVKGVRETLAVLGIEVRAIHSEAFLGY